MYKLSDLVNINRATNKKKLVGVMISPKVLKKAKEALTKTTGIKHFGNSDVVAAILMDYIVNEADLTSEVATVEKDIILNKVKGTYTPSIDKEDVKKANNFIEFICK